MQMKKIFGILLAIGFILTMTAGAVSAGGDDHYGDHDEHRGGHNEHFGEHQHGEHHHHHHEWRNNHWEDWDEDCWC